MPSLCVQIWQDPFRAERVMTDEQRVEAIERMKKARDKKQG